MGCSSSKHRRDDKNPPLPRTMSLPVINVKVDEAKKSSSGRPRRASNLKPSNEGGAVSVNEHEQYSFDNGDKWSHSLSGMQNDNRKPRQLDQSKTFSYGGDGDLERSFWGKENNLGYDYAGGKSRPLEDKQSDSRGSSFRSTEYVDCNNSGLRILLSPLATPSRSFSSSTRSGPLGKTLPPLSGKYHAYTTCNSAATTPRGPLTPNAVSAIFAQSNCNTPKAHMIPHAAPTTFAHSNCNSLVTSPKLHMTSTTFAHSNCNSLATSPKLHMASTTFARPLPDPVPAKVTLSEVEGMGDSEETIAGSPLFDPSILATFEKAIESSSDDSWNSSDVSNSSSRVGCSSSDTCSDADSPDWPKESGSFQDSPAMVGMPSYRPNNVPRRRASSTKPTRAHITKEDYLERFELKSPPGCKDKVVLYFTSLRGIRKTFEDCALVKLILKGYGVQVYERDVWMHSKFRQELTSVMGAVMPVPRLFIKGRYIGGVEDVKSLHEEGILEKLLEGLPAELNSTCSVCGSIRFIPCTTCSGSRKMITTDEILRCPDCNENGLIMCPSCDW